MRISPKVAEGIEKAGIPGAARHIFVCLGPDCCSYREGEHLWEHIKKRLKHAGIPVMRTKAGCFRICKEGPWMVVYPEGTWYNLVTPARFDRILAEHLVEGHPVEEWIAARNSLCGSCNTGEQGQGASQES